MLSVTDSVKRPYHSPARDAAAARTRALTRIRAAAERLFVEQGCTAITTRQVAKAAGIGERTR